MFEQTTFSINLYGNKEFSNYSAKDLPCYSGLLARLDQGTGKISFASSEAI